MEQSLAVGVSLQGCRQEIVGQTARLTHGLSVTLLSWARGSHCVRLPRPRLPVCQNRDIVTLHERIHAVMKIVPDAYLVHCLPKDPVENKELAALGRIDR